MNYYGPKNKKGTVSRALSLASFRKPREQWETQPQTVLNHLQRTIRHEFQQAFVENFLVSSFYLSKFTQG